MAAVAILAAGGLVFIGGGHSKGSSTPPVGASASSTPGVGASASSTPGVGASASSTPGVGASASSTPTSNPQVPTGTCNQVPASLDSPAGSPSTIAGQTAASVADTIVKYASEEINPDAVYFRLQNVTPPEGAALLATTMQVLGDQATQVTTATLMTPGGEDDSLAVYRFANPAQATALVRMFWVAGCAQQTHVDLFNGAVGAYTTVNTPGVINFFTDVVVAVGAYTVVYRLPGSLPASTTQPMIIQIVDSLESPNISPRVDVSDAIGPVAG
jgi:hypothetical protein